MSQAVRPFSKEEGAIIETAIVERRSVRAYLDKPVPREMVEHLLNIAARAPSGTNMQPWRAHVLTGAPKKALSDEILAEFQKSTGHAREGEYKYYPDQFFEPFLSRRRKVGFDMYGLLGIAKGDIPAMAKQTAQNYLFFGAPVGLIFTVHRKLEIGSWLDYGYFLEALSIAARANGLETCSQAAFAYFHGAVRRALQLPDEELVMCGLSLGYADWSATINTLKTERTPASEFATFQGF